MQVATTRTSSRNLEPSDSAISNRARPTDTANVSNKIPPIQSFPLTEVRATGDFTGQMAHDPRDSVLSFAQSRPPIDSDTVYALQRYENAARRLNDALKVRRYDWALFELPSELHAIPKNDDVTILREEISKVLTERKKSCRHEKTWSKARAIIEHVFVTLCPFAKHFLMIARNAQSV
jgi:hypothetical protein